MCLPVVVFLLYACYVFVWVADRGWRKISSKFNDPHTMGREASGIAGGGFVGAVPRKRVEERIDIFFNLILTNAIFASAESGPWI
jgi:hypothetical protein